MSPQLERPVLGMPVVFGEPHLDDGEVWTAAQFSNWVRADVGCDMLVEHREPIKILGEAPLGWWSRFALYPGGDGIPAGLLALGQVHSEVVFEDLRRSLLPQSPRGPYGLSVAAARMNESGPAWYYLGHIGLTRRPAIPTARVIAVGDAALSGWEMLTAGAERHEDARESIVNPPRLSSWEDDPRQRAPFADLGDPGDGRGSRPPGRDPRGAVHRP